MKYRTLIFLSLFLEPNNGCPIVLVPFLGVRSYENYYDTPYCYVAIRM
jgi:hypothetical protein